jgi:AcrR family transcriptional regulator
MAQSLAERQVGADTARRAAAPAAERLSHNLNGQKLGRKGRSTRERILNAVHEVLAESEVGPISLSAVARKASLGMTSLYNYFADLTELLLAVLEPLQAEAEECYVSILRERWSDDELGERAMAFMRGYFTFWTRNRRLLHLRNNMADNGDRRLMAHRVAAAQPVMDLLIAQMDGDPKRAPPPILAMAAVLMTGVERTVTVATNPQVLAVQGDLAGPPSDHLLPPEARVIELAIRDVRERFGRTAQN